MNDAPACEYRETTTVPDVYFCRHRQVRTPGNRVSLDICRACEWYAVPCAAPIEVSSQLPGERRAPSLGRQLWDLTKSMASFVADGCTTVSEDEYQGRLEICDACPERNGNRCLQCGCRLSLKARGRAFQCPLDKWPAIGSRTPDV